jgi:hypothetical protein
VRPIQGHRARKIRSARRAQIASAGPAEIIFDSASNSITFAALQPPDLEPDQESLTARWN